MSRYLFIANYGSEGSKGLAKNGGTDRRTAIDKLASDLGGHLESFDFAFGEDDAFVTVDLPSNKAAAAVALAVNGSGLVKAALDQDLLVVAEGETIFFSSGFGLPGLLKTSRSGLVLQPDGVEGQSVFRTSFPAYNRADQPEGRGFLVQRGRPETLQVALPS